MSATEEQPNHSRQYTVGFSIAAVLIFFILIIHLGRFIFRKIRKCLNKDSVEVIVTEIPVTQNDERKLSTHCIQQLELILKVEDEVSGIELCDSQRRAFFRSNSDNIKTLKHQTKRSTQRYRHSTVHRSQRLGQSFKQPSESKKNTFLAGYSHRHVNDE